MLRSLHDFKTRAKCILKLYVWFKVIINFLLRLKLRKLRWSEKMDVLWKWGALVMENVWSLSDILYSLTAVRCHVDCNLNISERMYSFFFKILTLLPEQNSYMPCLTSSSSEIVGSTSGLQISIQSSLYVFFL